MSAALMVITNVLSPARDISFFLHVIHITLKSFRVVGAPRPLRLSVPHRHGVKPAIFIFEYCMTMQSPLLEVARTFKLNVNSSKKSQSVGSPIDSLSLK